MKRLYFTFILSLFCMFAMAQTSEHATLMSKSYSRVSAGFSVMQTYSDVDDTKFDTDMLSPGGFIGFAYGHRLYRGNTTAGALYVEVGADLAFNIGSDVVDKNTKHEVETSMSILSADVPVNLVYKIPFRNYDAAFFFYGGLVPKANISAKMKCTTARERVSSVIIVGGHKVGTEKEIVKNSETFDMFSSEDMGDGYTAERFQLDADAGIGIEFGNLAIGYKFCIDLVPFHAYSLYKYDVNTSSMTHALSISYMFRK